MACIHPRKGLAVVQKGHDSVGRRLGHKRYIVFLLVAQEMGQRMDHPVSIRTAYHQPSVLGMLGFACSDWVSHILRLTPADFHMSIRVDDQIEDASCSSVGGAERIAAAVRLALLGLMMLHVDVRAYCLLEHVEQSERDKAVVHLDPGLADRRHRMELGHCEEVVL